MITKIVTILGGVGVVMGLFWGFSGVMDYFQGRKNRDKQKQDEGLESILYGGVLAAISAGIAASIVAALNALSF